MKIFNFIILFCFFQSFSQSLTFEKVIETEKDVVKVTLFNRVNSYLIEYFGNQKKLDANTIQIDKDLFTIKYKNSFGYGGKSGSSFNGTVYYEIEILIKDNKAKIILTNYIHEGVGISIGLITNDIEYPENKKTNNSWLGYRKKEWKSIIEKIEIEKTNKINTLQSVLNKPLKIEEDW